MTHAPIAPLLAVVACLRTACVTALDEPPPAPPAPVAAPAMETAMRECIPGGGGVVRLRLVSGPTGARFTFEPSAALGPRERRCVLEALSTIDPVSISDEASPAARPTGFTALFRIEW